MIATRCCFRCVGPGEEEEWLGGALVPEVRVVGSTIGASLALVALLIATILTVSGRRLGGVCRFSGGRDKAVDGHCRCVRLFCRRSFCSDSEELLRRKSIALRRSRCIASSGQDEAVGSHGREVRWGLFEESDRVRWRHGRRQRNPRHLCLEAPARCLLMILRRPHHRCQRRWPSQPLHLWLCLL